MMVADLKWEDIKKIQFSKAELRVLQEISNEPPGELCCFDISNSIGVEYTTVHHASKKLIQRGILSTKCEQNSKNAVRKTFQITPLGWTILGSILALVPEVP